jgi:flotillin
MGALATILFILVLAGIAIAVIIKKLLYICQPNEVLIFSGSHRNIGSRVVGYKSVKGGRKLKLPLVELVDSLDLTNMAINVEVHGAFSNGGIPLNVEGVANVKIGGEEPILGNAVERFLGKTREEIMLIAKETLEGNLRGVLAKLTPEQVNNDKLAFAKNLMEEADQDLNRLGLLLDTLKIQNVGDEVGYLDSIGRIKGAEIRRDAVIAEADSKALSLVRDASNVQETELVRIEASIRTLEADTKRRVADAQSQKAALEAEQRGQIAAAVVEAEAAVSVQTAKVEQVKRQLEADLLEPAKAEAQKSIERAKGDAAMIIEEGRATAEVLRQVTAVWNQAGPNARDVFLMEKLHNLVKTLTKTVENVKVDKITVLGTPNGGGDLAPKVINASEQLKAALGVDILGAVQGKLSAAPVKPTSRVRDTRPTQKSSTVPTGAMSPVKRKAPQQPPRPAR